MKNTAAILFLALYMLCAASAHAALELKWELADEPYEEIDTKGRYGITTIADGVAIEISARDFSMPRVLPLPSKARYLFRYETEVELLFVEGRARVGVCMLKDGMFLMFAVREREAELLFAHRGNVHNVTRSKMSQSLVPPVRIKMKYDSDTGDVEGFVDGVRVLQGNARTSRFPSLTSVTHTGPFVGTTGGAQKGRGVFKSVLFRGD